MVASVFDRLNRNGEPLTRQELRNSKYADSVLLNTLKELSNDVFWTDKLLRLKSVRMEDVEFISELFFLVLENKILDSSQDVLDDLYDKYCNNVEAVNSAKEEFLDIVHFISDMSIDFTQLKRLCWTTHLYSLFSFAWKISKLGITAKSIKDKIISFYTEYFSKNSIYEGSLKKYKDASSSRTRSDTQRNNRLMAMMEYCGIKD